MVKNMKEDHGVQSGMKHEMPQQGMQGMKHGASGYAMGIWSTLECLSDDSSFALPSQLG
jgi:hypothetical protein